MRGVRGRRVRGLTIIAAFAFLSVLAACSARASVDHTVTPATLTPVATSTPETVHGPSPTADTGGGAGPSPEPSATPAPPADPSPTPVSAGPSLPASAPGPSPDGAALFAANCAACHGTNGQGTAVAPPNVGASSAAVTAKVRSGGGMMPAFSATQISDDELALLADYVSSLASSGPGPSPTPTPTPTAASGTTLIPTSTPAPLGLRDGATLFSSFCAGCHGANGQGTAVAPPNVGASSAAVTAKVRSGGGMMPAFSAAQIGDAELALLADYVSSLGSSGLGPAPTPTPTPTPPPGATPTPAPTQGVRDGATLFSTYCAGCHGANGQGTAVAPPNAGGSPTLVTAKVRSGGGMMPAFGATQISDDELAALADYVSSMSAPGPAATPTPTPASGAAPTPTPAPPGARDGATLFSNHCAGCHGANGQGTAVAPRNAGASPAVVTAKVRSGGGMMPAFGADQISDAELALLADYVYGLGGPAPGPAPTPTPTPPPGATPTPTPTGPRAGATVFSTYCAGCHGANGQGTAVAPRNAGASPAVVTAKVRSGGGIMPAFSAAQISDAELALLADYVYGLGGPAPGPAPTPTPTPPPGATPTPTPSPTGPRAGATVFSTYCAGCHGASGQGTAAAPRNAGASPAVVTAKVRSGGGIMPAFSAAQISDAELALLADYVYGLGGPAPGPAPTPTPTPTPPPPGATPTPTPTPTPPGVRDGATLFSTYCAGCHGANGQGTAVAPRNAGTAPALVTAKVRSGGGIMPAFGAAQISDAELALLADYVYGLGAPTPTPTPLPPGVTPTPTPTPTPTGPRDGATVFATYCAVCHGAYGQGTSAAPDIAGKSLSDVREKVRRGKEGKMPAFGRDLISDVELDALAAYVRNLPSD